MYYILSCWILGEHGDRERISIGGVNKYSPEVSRQNPLEPSLHTLKKKRKARG
jgi:hypothetical protein